MAKQVFLSLGSNIGDRKENLLNAISLLKEHVLLPDICISPIYETEPFGIVEQNWFYNVVLSATTIVSPYILLFLCKSIEYLLGRRKARVWSERIIDIDILLYDEVVLDTGLLTIPHKYLHCRRFVLAPMCDIAKDIMHPVLGKSIKLLHSECSDNSIAKKI